MRLVVAAAALSAALSLAAPALADQQAAVPTAAQTRAADAEFHRVADQYEWRMRLMAEEMERAGSINEMRLIEARYQPEADAFADAIEARLASEQPTIRPYDNARKVRRLPAEIREKMARVRVRVRLADGPLRMGNASMNERTSQLESGRITSPYPRPTF